MSPLMPLPESDQLGRQFSRPSWSDSEFMVAANTFAAQTVQIPAGGQIKVASADPKRWVLIFVKQDPSTAQVRLWPNGADSTLGITMEIGDNLLRISMFDYGPLAAYDWYASCPAVCNMDVWSIQIGPEANNVP